MKSDNGKKRHLRGLNEEPGWRGTGRTAGSRTAQKKTIWGKKNERSAGARGPKIGCPSETNTRRNQQSLPSERPQEKNIR